MSEKKDSFEPRQTKPKSPEIINSGILKEKATKDLESRIIDTLRSLNGKLTRKEIKELFSRIEVSKGLDGLKKELQKEKKIGGKEISDFLLKAILDLIKESKEVAQKGIEELKLELNKLNESKVYDVDRSIYLTSRFPWIKKFEDSELGKNIIIDIAGIALGLVDSAQAIFKFLLELIKDLVMLPRDLIRRRK